MKKRYFIEGIIGLAFLLMMVLPFVSAYYLPTVRDGSQMMIDSVVDFFEPILQAILGGGVGVWNGDYLFGKLLLFVVILSVTYVAMNNIPKIKDNTPVVWIIAVVVSLLSVRYMDYNLIETALAQYRIFGIVLTTLLPFVIFFFFLHNAISNASMLRKVGWILFFLVYVGLWSTTGDEFMSMVYFWAFIASILMIVFDTSISDAFLTAEAKRINSMQIRLLINELEERRKVIATAPYPNEKARQKDLNDVNKLILDFTKQLPRS